MKTPQLPLKWMTNILTDDVYHVVTGRSTINSDILGNCYQDCRDEACVALLKVEAFCLVIFVFIPANDQLEPATSPQC